MRAPVCGISRNPLAGMRPSDMRRIKPGTTVFELAKGIKGTPPICIFNGEVLLRLTQRQRAHHARLTGEAAAAYLKKASARALNWRQTKVFETDVVELHIHPQNRKDFGTLLQVVGTVVSFYYPAVGFAISAAGSALAASYTPGQQRLVAPPQTADVFSTSLSGNQARLDQPIWKNCGHVEITPPFACQPYYETLPKPGASDPQLDRDQYYYALFAVGIGNHSVVPKIGNTPLTRFADVLIAQYLAPGVQPSAVKTNVTTSIEVSGQILTTARYVGGFAACSSKQSLTHVGVDVTATRGLGKTDTALTVTWRVECRNINDDGQVLSNWVTLANETRTAFTSTPQRWSNLYEVPGGGRVEVRLVRTNAVDSDPNALNEIAWTALRAYRSDVAPLNPNTAHFEVQMRASSQLSQIASQDFRLIVDSLVRTWDPSDWWGAEVASRNPGYWLLDIISSEVWGIGQPESHIDFQSFYDFAQTCEERQDRFDYTFDTSMNAWDAMQMIARTGRARVFRRNGVVTIARDGLADLPVTAFTPRNCIPDSMKFVQRSRKSQSPDGVLLEYRDWRTGEWTVIECPCPGVTSMTNPVYKRIEGIIGRTHALREGVYEAAVMLYRTRTAEWTTEMQGLLPACLSPVTFQAGIPGYGQAGDVTDWDEASLTMQISEPADFTAGIPYLTLRRDDGSLTVPVQVLPGPTPNQVVLPAAPDFPLVLDDGRRERPQFLLGQIDADDLVKVISIADGGLSDGGAQLYSLGGFVDDDRVHAADNAYLPGPGEIQDPIGYPDDDAGGGNLLLVNIRSHQWFIQGQSQSLTLTFAGDGTMSLTGDGTGPGTGSPDLTGEWLLAAPYDPSEAAQFDLYFEEGVPGASSGIDGAGTQSGPTMNTWLPGGTDYVFTVNSGAPAGRAIFWFTVRIRDAETLQELGTATWGFGIDSFPYGD